MFWLILPINVRVLKKIKKIESLNFSHYKNFDSLNTIFYLNVLKHRLWITSHQIHILKSIKSQFWFSENSEISALYKLVTFFEIIARHLFVNLYSIIHSLNKYCESALCWASCQVPGKQQSTRQVTLSFVQFICRDKGWVGLANVLGDRALHLPLWIFRGLISTLYCCLLLVLLIGCVCMLNTNYLSNEKSRHYTHPQILTDV